MKTQIFLLTIAIFFSVNLLASDTITHVENKTEEVTVCDKKTNQPIKRFMNSYNENKQLISRVIFKCDKDERWTPIQKLEYTYDATENKTPATVTCTKWDAIQDNWERKSQKTNCNGK